MRRASQDMLEVVAGLGEECVDLIAGRAEEVISLEPTRLLGMADRGLDRCAAFELAFHGQREVAFDAEDHNPGFAVIVETSGALVDVEALDHDLGGAA